MKAAQITEAGSGFEIVEREIPTPGPNQVRGGGDIVAVFGIGGLGHLVVQFARKI